MNHTLRNVLIATAIFLAMGKSSEADLLTVEWAPDAVADRTGTGMLGGTTVTYTSFPQFLPAGVTLGGFNWAAYAGTGGATDGAVTSQTAGVLSPGGLFSVTTTQAIEFSSSVANPILLVNFLDLSNRFNFGANAFTLLDSHNAVVTPPLIIGTRSFRTADPNDGFAIRFEDTFGPGTPLLFSIAALGVSTGTTVGFTIGVQQNTSSVPEPSTLALAASVAGLIGGGVAWRRRRRAA